MRRLLLHSTIFVGNIPDAGIPKINSLRVDQRLPRRFGRASPLPFLFLLRNQREDKKSKENLPR